MVGFTVDGFAEDEGLMRLDRPRRKGAIDQGARHRRAVSRRHAGAGAGPWLETALRSVTQSNAGALSILRAAGVDAATS
jgi:hypothetical protein